MSETTVVQETPEQVEVRLRSEFEEKFRVWQEQDLTKLKEEQDNAIQTGLAKYFEDYQKKLKPPTKEEIQDLLEQEYLSFTVKLKVGQGERVFTIGELPQTAEKRFYKQFKDRLTSRSKDIAALAQRTMDQPFERKIQAFLDTFEGSFEVLADAALIVLNYNGSDKEITREWLQDNLTSYRMWNIVKAQMEVNRLRSFFSELSQSGMGVQQMTSPLNSQQLLQQQA